MSESGGREVGAQEGVREPGSRRGGALASGARGQGGPSGRDGAGIGASACGLETSQVSRGGDMPAS